ncbi:hypothetical protein M2347_003185 [Chryseobacterium sp. H1D6B]|uniref:hypothetical protein n=1 Tax=Chryseobacterium sp. H1D6B TaxID=2940588 RepID=UPI0015CE0078|nr:hypothetical protein [Chryseobacterium sp. H1D6B]MDH6253458.1 hypothetical protein [Chryseobacterium sp. H1D6B]
MKKKLFIQLLLFFTSCLALYSCIHDDVSSAADPALKEYTNKSLWKEDEKYIKNVMEIYQANEDKIKKTSGTPYWDYALTLESFDESFLMVPIVEAERVVSVMQVPRHGSKIRFYYTNFKSQIDFFQALISAQYKKAILSDAPEADKTIVCKTVTVSVWLPDNESNPDPGSGAGHWGTHSVIKCKQVLDNCSGVVGPDGQCITGGAGDPGDFPYPGGGGGTPEIPLENPCTKLGAQTADVAFKSKTDFLKTKFNDSNESGFRVGSPVPGSGQTGNQYQQLSNKPGTNNLDFKIFNTTNGIMHSHYDVLIPIFSPGDINLFIQLLQNAQANNIPLSEVFLSVVTSQGVYQLRGDGINVDNLTMYTDNQIETFNGIYSGMIGSPNISKEDLQKGFLKFMKENMNIDGAKLYETSTSGDNKELYLNGNNNLASATCP